MTSAGRGLVNSAPRGRASPRVVLSLNDRVGRDDLRLRVVLPTVVNFMPRHFGFQLDCIVQHLDDRLAIIEGPNASESWPCSLAGLLPLARAVILAANATSTASAPKVHIFASNIPLAFHAEANAADLSTRAEPPPRQRGSLSTAQ